MSAVLGWWVWGWGRGGGRAALSWGYPGVAVGMAAVATASGPPWGFGDHGGWGRGGEGRWDGRWGWVVAIWDAGDGRMRLDRMGSGNGVDPGLLLDILSRLPDFSFSPVFPASVLLPASRFGFSPVYPVTLFLPASRLAFWSRLPGLFSSRLPGYCSPPGLPVCIFLPDSRYGVFPGELLGQWYLPL